MENIIKNGGLYSWKDCEERGINIPKPGGGGPGSPSWSLDKRDNLEHYVRVSFTMNHPMMYVAMNEDRISNPVILEIDPEVIYDEDTKYVDRNAVRNGAHVGGSLEDFKKIHFQTVKARNHFDFDVDEQPFYQAEILVKNNIPLKYIKTLATLVFRYQVSLSCCKARMHIRLVLTVSILRHSSSWWTRVFLCAELPPSMVRI